MIKVRKGTSIIEIVIAATLISISIIAALSLTNQSQKQNTYAKNSAEATKYASQGADWLRNERDTLGYATIYSMDDNTYCLNLFPTNITLMDPDPCDDSDVIAGTIFQREVSILKSVDYITAVITVSWMENTERQTKIEMELTSWH